MLEESHRRVDNLIEKANPKAYVADAARLAIREVGNEYKFGAKNEVQIITSIEEALTRYAPGEVPVTAEQWKEVALISGEELIRDLALLGFDKSDEMIAAYRDAVNEYLKYILEKQKQ